MTAKIAELPFVTLSEGKGLIAQGGILRFAQNDRCLLRRVAQHGAPEE